MDLWNYVEAACFVSVLVGVILAVPYYLLYERFFGVSRPTLLLSLLGSLTFLGLLRPPGVPLWAIWLVCFVGLGFARLYSRGAREPLFASLRDPLAWLLLLPVPVLHFARWEPLGDSLLQAATLARLIQRPEGFWGDAMPFFNGSLEGVQVGLPLIAALLHLGEWAPVERVLSFLNLAAFSLFAFSMASGWNTWFSRRASLVGACVLCLGAGLIHDWALVGGAEILFALTTGMVLLEYARSLRVGAPDWPRVGIFAFALAFGFYCHFPVAGYTVLVFSPVCLWMTLRSPRWLEFMEGWGRLCAVTLVTVLPLFLVFSFPDSDAVALTWDRYKQMMPGLMGPNSLLVDGARQISLWLSVPTLFIGLLGFLLHLQYDGRPMTFVPSLLLGFFSLVSIASIRYGAFPGSWLLHPQATAFPLLFALGIALPWGVDRLYFEGVRKERRSLVIGLCLVVLAGMPSLGKRLGELWNEPGLTPAHNRVMHYAYQFLPPKECVKITSRVEAWLAPIAERCVVPFYGLPFHVSAPRSGKRLAADWALGTEARGLAVHKGAVPLVRISNKPLPVPAGRD